MDIKFNTRIEDASEKYEARGNNLKELKEGIRDGIPIGLSYLPVYFTLGDCC